MKMVLVLDDDQSNLRIFKAILWSKGYNVLKVMTPQAAFATAKLHPKLDLLVSDAGVKGDNMSGTDVAVALSRRYENLPVVLVSGLPLSSWCDTDCRNMRKLLLAGVEVLQKPVLLRVFEDAVDRLFARTARNYNRRLNGNLREG